MKYGLYSIFNLDTEEFSAPIVFKTEKMAVNSFVRHIETSYQKDKRFFCPADFDLFYIGTFSDTKGDVVAKEHRCVMLGSNVDLSLVDDEKKKVKEEDRYTYVSHDKDDKDNKDNKDDGTWTVDDDTWTEEDDEDED